MTDDAHGYADKLNDQDLQDLANFVGQGQVDMDPYIDRASKAPIGDAVKGEAYYTLFVQNVTDSMAWSRRI